MSKKRAKIGDQIRQAVNDSDMSRYAICKATGIDQASFSRFMAGKVGLTLLHIEGIADLLGLRIVQDKPKAKAR
jgi:predicted XRE-type DNA-binding protein